jgi:hypothetical protein
MIDINITEEGIFDLLVAQQDKVQHDSDLNILNIKDQNDNDDISADSLRILMLNISAKNFKRRYQRGV